MHDKDYTEVPNTLLYMQGLKARERWILVFIYMFKEIEGRNPVFEDFLNRINDKGYLIKQSLKRLKDKKIINELNEIICEY